MKSKNLLHNFEMPKSRKVTKGPKRKRNLRGSYVPIAGQERMINDYAIGGKDNSIFAIAKRYNRAQETVSKIVKPEEPMDFSIRSYPHCVPMEGAMDKK
jgi:hypothetical protein